MKAFETRLQGANINVDITAVREDFDEVTTTVTEFTKIWREVLAEHQVPDVDARDLLEQIPALIEQYPVPGEEAYGLPSGVTQIEDLKIFKAALRISDPPKPLIEWNDLPTPNL